MVAIRVARVLQMAILSTWGLVGNEFRGEGVSEGVSANDRYDQVVK